MTTSTDSLRNNGFKMTDTVIGMLLDRGYERTDDVYVGDYSLSVSFVKGDTEFHYVVLTKKNNTWALVSNVDKFDGFGNGIRSLKAHLSSILFSN